MMAVNWDSFADAVLMSMPFSIGSKGTRLGPISRKYNSFLDSHSTLKSIQDGVTNAGKTVEKYTSTGLKVGSLISPVVAPIGAAIEATGKIAASAAKKGFLKTKLGQEIAD